MQLIMQSKYDGCVLSDQDSTRILLNSSFALVIETSHLARKAYPVPIMSMIEHARAREDPNFTVDFRI